MPLAETTLQRQLDRAKQDLTNWGKKLEEQGVATTDRSKNAKWRQLSAAMNTIRQRMKAAAGVRTRDAEVARLKAEKLAAPKEEKISKKGAKDAKPAKDKAKKADKGEKAEKPAEPKKE